MQFWKSYVEFFWKSYVEFSFIFYVEINIISTLFNNVQCWAAVDPSLKFCLGYNLLVINFCD